MEGRNDVRNLLNCGIKNAISADGAGDIKQELIDLANGKDTVIVAIDGDRGGEMLFQQLNGTMKVDFVAQAPVGQEWELLPQKTVTVTLSKGGCRQVRGTSRQEAEGGRRQGRRARQGLGRGHGRILRSS